MAIANIRITQNGPTVHDLRVELIEEDMIVDLTKYLRAFRFSGNYQERVTKAELQLIAQIEMPEAIAAALEIELEEVGRVDPR
jgi:hypothetical protein